MRVVLMTLGAVVVVAAVAVGLLIWIAEPAEPGAFYRPPDDIPGFAGEPVPGGCRGV